MNKYKIFILTILLSVTFLTMSCDDTGSMTYGGYGNQQPYAVQETKDGGAIIVGVNTGNVYVLKVDSMGKEKWNKTVGGENSDWGYDVKETSDGGYVVIASTENYGPGDPNYYGSYGNALIIKYSANGSKLWQKVYGYDQYDGPNSIAVTEDGGLIVAGYTHSFGGGDFWVLKLDANGNKQWDNHYGNDRTQVGRSIKVVPGNGYIIVGSTNDEATARLKGYVVKIDNNGNEEWSAEYGDTSKFHTFYDVIVDGNNYVMAGYTSSDIFPNNDSDAYLVKINATGTVIWEKTIGGTLLDQFFKIVKGTNGGYVMAGVTRSYGQGSSLNGDMWIVKVDVNGNQAWSRTYGTDKGDIARGLDVTDSGGYLLVGETMTGLTSGYDILLYRLDSNGEK